MHVLEGLLQGQPEWHAARAAAFCASEVAAAAGESKYMSREELLRFKATGVAEEVSARQQALFDAGHASEKKTRPIAEGIMGTDLYPVVATLDVDGMNLLASLDGVDMLETQIWENKLLNASLVEQCRAGDLDAHYHLQIEQQLLVSGAERCLFTTSDGTPENTHSLWYESRPERRAKVIAVWKQFAKDLAAWKPSDAPAAEPAPVGKAPATLPALLVELKGEVTASNLDEFKDVALTAIRSVNRDLKTDQDFADSAKARKWCEDIEARVKATKEHAMAQTATIDMLFKALDEISEEARTTRLALKKTEDARTLALNSEIVADGIAKFRTHIDALNATMPGPYMPKIAADFGGCIAKLRSVDSKRNAVNTELARAKIEADAVARNILVNLKVIGARPELAFLFNDTATIVLKATDDLALLVKTRISDHEAAEAKKAEALRASIAAEEQTKAERKAREATAVPAPAPAPVVAQVPVAENHVRGVGRADGGSVSLANMGGFGLTQSKCDGNHGGPACADPECWNADNIVDAEVPRKAAAVEDDGSRINLRDINARIAPLEVTAAGLAELGWPHVGTDKASKLFREVDLPQILASMLDHLRRAHRKAADEAAKAQGLPF